MTRRTTLGAQGAYYLVTGIAPFVSRAGFEAVTGRKREWWLVQTVGVVVTAIGAGLVSAAARDRITPEITMIAAGAAAGLGAIDVAYAARRRIAPSYFVDAVAQAATLAALARAR
jgi:hypothetical protein